MSRPALGRLEAEAIQRVLASGYLGMGEEVREFERELSEFFNRPVACCHTGTSALQLALSAIGIGPGDEVIVPSLTFVATFQAAAALGARPVPCDVRLADGLLDVADAERRITTATRAIIPVHFAGNAANLDEVYDLAARRNLRVVEDAAHAFGSRHRGARVGAAGDIACFSFDPIKNITSGEGGAIVSSDEAVLDIVRRRRQLGITRHRDTTVIDDGDGCEVTELGWRYHMPDLCAAIGRVQLSRFGGELGPARTALAAGYQRQLQGVPYVTCLALEEGAVPHIFPVRVLDGRRECVRRALADAGVETGVHYKPNHLHTPFASPQPLPNSERLWSELVSLPMHPQVTAADVARIAETVHRAVQ